MASDRGHWQESYKKLPIKIWFIRFRSSMGNSWLSTGVTRVFSPVLLWALLLMHCRKQLEGAVLLGPLSQETPWLDKRGHLLCSMSKACLRTKWLWLHKIWREMSWPQPPRLGLQSDDPQHGCWCPTGSGPHSNFPQVLSSGLLPITASTTRGVGSQRPLCALDTTETPALMTLTWMTPAFQCFSAQADPKYSSS